MHLRLSVLLLLVWIVFVLLRTRLGPISPNVSCTSLTCVSSGPILVDCFLTLRLGLGYGCLNCEGEKESNLVDTLGTVVRGGKERDTTVDGSALYYRVRARVYVIVLVTS